MLLMIFLPGFGMGAGGAPEPPAPPVVTPSRRRGGKPKERPLFRFHVELGGESFYFWTESEAETFLKKQARSLYRRAKAVARKTHRIELPSLAQPIPLPSISPIPRFVVTGSSQISLLTQQINAQIDAILANPYYEAQLDDEDLERLLNDFD